MALAVMLSEAKHFFHEGDPKVTLSRLYLFYFYYFSRIIFNESE